MNNKDLPKNFESYKNDILNKWNRSEKKLDYDYDRLNERLKTTLKFNRTSVINEKFQENLNHFQKRKEGNIIKIDVTKEVYPYLTAILYNSTSSNTELFLNFTEDYYSGDQYIASLSIPVYGNITFYSENSTVIDLLQYRLYTWFLNFNIASRNTEKIVIKFKNITIKNYLSYPFLLYIFYITPSHDNYQFIFENCNFNNVGYIDGITHTEDYFYKIGAINALFPFVTVNITNTIFENINIENNLPLMALSGAFINISNNYFKNCFSNANHLIEIQYFNGETYPELYLFENNTFENTDTLFDFKKSTIILNGLYIRNCDSMKVTPLIDNTLDSTVKITINDGVFENLKFKGNNLIGSEATYTLNNIKMYNITTSNKPILYATRKNFIITNSYISEIQGNGEITDTTLLKFDTESNIYASLDIINTTISNCVTNNPLIKILAEKSNAVNFNDVIINNIQSYGPLIENTVNNATMNLINSRFYNNKNKHQTKCGGTFMRNNINLYIKNSYFSKNENDNFGGALCLNNIKNLKLYIESSSFYDNKSMNGGAIYFLGKEDSEHFEVDITMKNLVFDGNIAEEYGGAIYSEYNGLYKTYSYGLTFKNNIANIAGGALYTPTDRKKNLLMYEDLKLNNNSGLSYGNDISSSPAYAVIKSKYDNETLYIPSGSYLSFNFKLYDESNIFIEDKMNYLNKITIRAELYNTINSKNYLTGNICTFTYGECKLNNLKILAAKEQYTLKFNIDSIYNTTIKGKKEYNIIITNCSKNEIGILSNNGLLSCETPICNSECPTTTTAIYNFIIESFYFVLALSGEVLILIVFSLFIFYGTELGIKDCNNENTQVLLTSFFKNNKNSTFPEIVKTNTMDKSILQKSDLNNPVSSVEYARDYDVNNIATDVICYMNSARSEKHYSTENFNKTLTKLCSLNIEYLFIYPLIIIFSISLFILIYYFSDNENYYHQDINNEWYYKSIIGDANLYGYSTELLFMLIILYKGRKLFEYIYIYKCCYYITISVIFWIVFGPIQYIISYSFFPDNRKGFVMINYISNNIEYLIIMMLFYWDKFYYILINQGDNPLAFFVFEHNDKYVLGDISVKDNNISMKLIEDYINLYKECSKVVQIVNGKIKFTVNKSHYSLPHSSSFQS
ncbi:hypothetical protein LY90DRAFT_669544 [Neocallimastix californiae]|uniref:Right handed beta helix domain-containing protein n=1 Tax=Neocallimastix californiae TaxID=1754190 RepID=A0A1Y2DA16_9FUNG|nr:hypothetical protein LY90DRAFT_669544 [Neocallimastix californiae]|eukprot:ORY56047.1 hypothetical protein LY90DRAFT_669544 [Neocallimastix californiae]